MKRRKILLGEESTIIALGFEKLLESSAYFQVVSHVEKFAQIEEKIVTTKPDIIIVNPALTGAVKGDGETINRFEEIKIVALVHNYIGQDILKQYNATIDINDTRQEVENKLNEALAKESEEEEKLNYELSERETDVLIAVAKGMQNKEIADNLNISIHTVISHRKNIVAKTGIKSVAGLTVYALINNLINESDVMF